MALLILLVCITGSVSAAEVTGDWNKTLIISGLSGQHDADVYLASMKVGDWFGNVSDPVSQTDEFTIPVNLVSTFVLNSLYVYGTDDYGYLFLPNEAINAKTLSGCVEWQGGNGTLEVTTYVTSFFLEDPPENPIIVQSRNGVPLGGLVPPLEGGIPTHIYLVLMIMLVVFVLYTFVDLDNRLYAPIVSALLSTILAYMLAILSINGSVGEFAPVLVNQSVVNNTTVLYGYEAVQAPLHSGALGWFFVLIGVIMTVLSVYLIVEAFWEYKNRIDNEEMDDV